MISIQTLILTTILGGIGGAFITTFIVFFYFKQKGIDISKFFNAIEQVLNVTGSAIDMVEKIAPNNSAVNMIKIIDQWIEKGVKGAEQMYYIGKINAEDRNKVAKEVVFTALKQFNITPDSEQQKLIDVCIEAIVNDLGHNNKKYEH